MRRFYVPPGTVAGDQVRLEGPLARRLARVLRLRPGDVVVLFDGSGREHLVRLSELSEAAACGRVVESRPGLAEPAVEVILYQSPVKGERFEWVLEKGTELGVARFVPLVLERAVVRPSPRGARAARWERIVIEAAEQCGRAILPEVSPPQTLAEALASAPGLRILPYEGEGGLGLRGVLREKAREPAAGGRRIVSLLIGPEGGFEAEEVRLAREVGVHVVSLGARILRSETAGIVAAAAVLYEFGGLGA